MTGNDGGDARVDSIGGDITGSDAPTDIVTDRPSDGPAGCANDMECTDGVYCNGVEHCMPGAPGANAQGCVAASPATPCMAGQTCSETMQRCQTMCDVSGDADGDGHRAMNCGGDDCDDADANRFPGRTEVCDTMMHDEDCDPTTFGFRDGDGDSYGDARCCNVSGTTMMCGDDCNDSRPNVHPSLAEVCDGLDNNCDGATDEGVVQTFYVDGDGDGFGTTDTTMSMMGCTPPAGYASSHTDCNDADQAVNPSTPEICDAANVDENCDGMANPPSFCSCTAGMSRMCMSAGACLSGTQVCVAGQWGACSIMPVAESCNGVDDDCDGQTDEGVSITCYPDMDNDGYPSMGAAAAQVCPTSGREFVGGCPANQTNRAPMGMAIDCNDADPTVSPGSIEVCDAAMVDENCDGAANPMTLCMCSGSATRTCPLPGACAAGMQTCVMGSWSSCSISPITESCNGVDDNCDGTVDEGLTVVCYDDDDNDTYSASGSVAMNVCPVSGRTTVGGCPTNQTNRAPSMGGDCAPTDPSVNPGQPELCDMAMVDENCSGAANEGCTCTTGAMRSCPQPGACAAGMQSCTSGTWGACSISPIAEACNGIDDNCDGTVDEGLVATCYADSDNDTYAPAGASSSSQCTVASRTAVGGCPDGYTNRAPTSGNTDCVDTDALRNPAGAESCNMQDDDCDGMTDEGLTVTCYADNDGDTYAAAGAASSAQCPDPSRPMVGGCPVGLTNRAPTAGNIDCADGNAMVNPSITETCNSVDDNCNGTVDESLRVTCFPDMDGDTYAPASSSMTYCPQPGRESVGGCPSGFTNRAPVSMATDCNDANPLINPTAMEQCDMLMVDENCDGTANPAALCSCSGSSSRPCPLPGACAAGSQTCSGGMWGTCSIAPTMEICDNVDNDCDAMTDEGLRVTCYVDGDDDGYPPAGAVAMAPSCPVPGRAAVGGCPSMTTNRAPTGSNIDCADGDATRNPAAVDICNNVDDNCNGTVDDTTSANASCTAPYAYNACRAGSCVIIACQPLRGDCDGDPVTGCEASLNTPSDCGACGMDCGVGSACYSGRCDSVYGVQTSGSHTCAWRESGYAACWGSNGNGQLGNNSTANAIVPVVPGPTILSPLTGVVDVGTGSGFSCARRYNSASGQYEVWCWGANSSGQLGNGSTTQSAVPVRTLLTLPAGVSIATLTVGGSHSCVRLSDSSLRCWGSNVFGQLGNGSTAAVTTPVTVSGVTTALEVSAGGNHTCTRISGGTIRCWGYNNAGQLGNNTITNSSLPVTVSTITSAIGIAAGGSHTCARTTSASVWCWGENSSGQLGTNSFTDSHVPVRVEIDTTGTAYFTTASDITAGAAHTCVTDTNPSGNYPRVSCWGYNFYGQLGDGTTTNSSLPRFNGTLTDVIDIRAGAAGNTTCARRRTNQLTCWGSNSSGQVGNNTTSTSVTTPTPVVNLLPATVRSVEGGWSHACALLPDGHVMCWGDNGQGQLGDGTTTDRAWPALANTNDITQLSVGGYTTCARTRLGQVRCWGQNGSGQLGNGMMVNSPAPVTVTGLSGAAEVDVGDAHVCARLASGQVTCWGNDSFGQLGDSTSAAPRLAPTTPVPSIGSAGTDFGIAVDLGVGSNRHSCARLSNGNVVCWGDNSSGQVGNGSAIGGIFPPGLVANLNDALEVDAGLDATCVRRADGTVGCWGAGSAGQIGDGTGMVRRTVTPVDLLTNVRDISMQNTSACAIDSTNTLRCWGNNTYGQIGDGTMTNRFSPQMMGVSGTSWISAGRGYNLTCATRRTTANPLPVGVACWGQANVGQLGYGFTSVSNITTPVSVRALP